MEEIQWNPNLELLPQHILEDFELLYHGTSAVYSDDIEKNGFRLNHLPFPNEGLREIINLLADLGETSNYNPNTFQIDFNHAGAIDHYLAHQHPISFTVGAYPALKFASGQSKGGQIVGKVKQSFDRIRLLINQVPDSDENKLELIRRLESVQYIDDECNAIANASGVVYVIKPSSEIIKNLYVDHKVVFLREILPVENIIAKITVDRTFELPENFRSESKNVINNHFSYPGAIGYRIFKSELENDNTED